MTDKNGFGVRWGVFIVLTVLFFMIFGHDFSFSLKENFDATGVIFEDMVEEGNPIRRAGLAVLGIFSLCVLIFWKGYRNLSKPGLLGGLIVFFLIYAASSAFWSVDHELTIRRLVVLAIIWLTAISISSMFHINNLAYFTFFSSGIFLITGIGSELLLGTFQPLSEGYRLSGTAHPNVQGENCALLLLSAITILAGKNNHRYVFIFTAVLATAALVLTGSRTSFISAVSVLLIAFVILPSLTHKKKYLLLGSFSIILAVGVILVFLSYNGLFHLSTSGVHLGRDPHDMDTLNGRIQIWAACLKYVFDRPMFGHGYEGFWNLLHINQLSSPQGWGVKSAHSAYIELLLNVGMVGTIIYLAFLTLGIKEAFSNFRRQLADGYLFLLMLLIFYLFHGILESRMAQICHGTFLVMWGLSSLAFTDPEWFSETQNNF